MLDCDSKRRPALTGPVGPHPPVILREQTGIERLLAELRGTGMQAVRRGAATFTQNGGHWHTLIEQQLRRLINIQRTWIRVTGEAGRIRSYLRRCERIGSVEIGRRLDAQFRFPQTRAELQGVFASGDSVVFLQLIAARFRLKFAAVLPPEVKALATLMVGPPKPEAELFCRASLNWKRISLTDLVPITLVSVAWMVVNFVHSIPPLCVGRLKPPTPFSVRSTAARVAQNQRVCL